MVKNRIKVPFTNENTSIVVDNLQMGILNAYKLVF